MLLDAPVEDPRVQSMRNSIIASIALEESSSERGFRLLDLIWDRSDLRVGRRIRISFMILALQQMMGTKSLVLLEDCCCYENSVKANGYFEMTRYQSLGIL